MPDEDAVLVGLDPYELLDAEAERIERYYAKIDAVTAVRPSRCRGWSVRDVLAHLAATEEYHQACLDDELPRLVRKLGEAGASSLDSVNAYGIAARDGYEIDELLDEWRTLNSDTRLRLRRRDGGLMETSVGPYPVRRQAFHLAAELATHADDAFVPVDPSEDAARTAWRAQFSRFALAEEKPFVEVVPDGDRYRVRAAGTGDVLGADELVEAVMGRLPPEHPVDPVLRAALPVV